MAGPSQQPGLGTESPDSIFKDYPGPEIDAAKTIMKNFMAYLGWPVGVDSNALALHVLEWGYANKPMDAYATLFNSSYLSDEQRKKTPWAKFGMDPDSYRQGLASVADMVQTTTGMTLSLDTLSDPMGQGKPETDAMQSLLQNALRGNWSQKQISDAFQSGSFYDQLEGKSVDLSTITVAQPWLAAGQTYQSQAAQFSTIFGAPPVDTQHLAGWYNFNKSAASLGPWYSQKVSETAGGPKPQAEVR